MAVFFRIVIMWLYNSSGRSVLVVALSHSAFNSATSLGEQKFTGELISGSALLYAIGALVAIAVVVAVFTGAVSPMSPSVQRRKRPRRGE